MEIFVANEQPRSVDESALSTLARHALESEDLDDGVELSVLLVDAPHIRQLNARFAGDDHPTDVLSFPMGEDDENDDVLGDVVLCPDVAQRNAERLGHSLDLELNVLLVHGILHLLGYDHQDRDDRAEMETRMRAILESFSPSPT